MIYFQFMHQRFNQVISKRPPPSIRISEGHPNQAHINALRNDATHVTLWLTIAFASTHLIA